ncbi:MAG: glycosyltransferase [Candidatus Omnitrophica bacterium]|nr:glycosyltransferase [Candidatus Omnitrophota bacterium]MCF7877190.1 glycosyltransferase [Candidatus Omnitrophota bacterium]MCF7877991.1 glycosyltransferase [Candidatus Omnitrophota bacterium]MCF7892917.1 glycosyltransferase [Candidatus Omnitrophota bacterium]
MKVIQILPKMKAGGVERGVLDLVNYFKNQKSFSNFESVVISAGGNLTYLLDQAGIKHYKMPVDKKSPLSLFLVHRISKLILKEKPDIIHARSRVPAWIAFFATRNKNCHFITTAHGIYRNKISSEVMGWGKLVICPSKTVARHMKEKFGVPEEKILIIPRWVDLDKFKYTDYQSRIENNFIVAVGRISPTKGYQYLIDAFRKVVRFKPYLKLKIVGSVDKNKSGYLDYLKTLVTRFSLNYNVEFTGFSQNIENILAQAKILVAPSVIEEAFGRVVIEAAACGVPVVATKVGGFQEIIDDKKDGLLVPPSDVDSLSEAILKLVDDPKWAQKLSIQAREKVSKYYSMDKALDSLGKVYEKAVNEKRILITKISSLGDIVLAIPSLARLRQEFPKAKIYLLTLKKYASFFYNCPYLDKVITVSSDYKKIKKIFQISKKLRRLSFDYIVDLQNNRASQLIAFLSFGRKTFGFRRKLGFLLNHTAVYKKKEMIDPLESQERILKLLGVTFLEKKLLFWQTKPLDLSAFNLGENELIGINVSASEKWKTKNWPVENINRFIKLFIKKYPGYRVLLLGDERGISRAEAIKKINKSRNITNLCGKTEINELIEILKKLKLFITPDTATLHLAQSLGTEIIGLFGPTNSKLHTVEAVNLKIIEKDLSCRYCYKGICSTNQCMKDITAKEVLSSAAAILGKIKY